MNNQVVVEINETRQFFECAFRDGISEQLFERLSELCRVPGWSVDYGVDTRKGDLDKSVAQIYYNKSKEAQDAAKSLETSLRDVLGFREILWKRDIDYGSRSGSHVSDVFS
jgi:hypothetical protein